ncbi:prepilin-type N-terminal cleavage/methylation domain-containing protein [Vibrio sp. SCSIO 43136]|uniref:PilW family protein n=1 Tax=Vibrio sp. SCSIO 43136 TaxID=2819101 RepID=UPI0020763EBE|nr:prepilin-type N-terminal cleavage/methylation domain-containing protein [Vibrio sp. SCSIO 43136]USD65846.1 prepilin-type N-terminal cleavage/methylation domain-containing protein [Vibrio sp. SCSIO 43136]
MVIRSAALNRGYSLVELMVALFLTSLVILAVGSLYISVLKEQVKRTEKLAVMQGLNEVSGYLKNDLLRAGYSDSGLLTLSGSNKTIWSTASEMGYRYYFDGEYIATKFKLVDGVFKLCRKKSSSEVFLSDCTHYFSMTDPNVLLLSQFSVTSHIFGFDASHKKLSITMSAANPQGEYGVEQAFELVQRN